MKTTIAGILIGLLIIIPEILQDYDDNPRTVMNIERIVLGLTFMGFGVVAKDQSSKPEVKSGDKIESE